MQRKKRKKRRKEHNGLEQWIEINIFNESLPSNITEKQVGCHKEITYMATNKMVELFNIDDDN